MTARPEQSSFPSSIGFLLTYRCTIYCPHCFVEAGPGRKEKMALGSAFGWIDEAAAYGEKTITHIELTGGEPFYDLQTLALVSDHAMHAGLSVSVSTNAGWAGSLEQAILTLNELPAIRKISISTDSYHQQFIPDGHIHNAVIAAELLGRQYDVTIATESEQDDRYLKIVSRLERIVDASRIMTTITVPAGRALKQTRSLRRKTSPEPAQTPCRGLGTPVILPDGRVMACSGPMMTHESSPLYLGNLRKESLATVLDRSGSNLLMQLIMIWGPHRMVSLLRSRGHGDLLPKEFLHGSGCDICRRVLSDRNLAALLNGIVEEPDNRNVIAYARMQQLDGAEKGGDRQHDVSGLFDTSGTLQ